VRRLPGADRLVEALGGVDDVRRLPPGINLNPLQERAVACLSQGRDYVGDELAPLLAAVDYPVHFLDFETFMPAVPRYIGTAVYETLPVQWSDHVLAADGTLSHGEFLHTEDTDPRRPFAASLVPALGEHGTIVVYSGYEATQIRAAAEAVPEHRDALLRLLDRILDLHAVVKAHYYHPDLEGSFSLKSVAPVLAPAVHYGDIANGVEAVAAYEEMIAASTPPARRTEIERQLRFYCQIDTLAMVEIRRVLLGRPPSGATWPDHTLATPPTER
jgi:hypothetical protein